MIIFFVSQTNFVSVLEVLEISEDGLVQGRLT